MDERETPASTGAEGATERPVRWRRTLVLFALGPLSVLATWLASLAPAVTDEVYSQRVFPAVRWLLLTAVGWVPISVAEPLLGALVVVLVGVCVRGLREWRAGRRRLANLAQRGLAFALAFSGLAVFVFQLVWGFNHARLSIAAHLDLEIEPVGAEVLGQIVRDLGREAGRERARLGADRDSALELRGKRDPRLTAAWKRASDDLSVLGGPDPLVRRPWISPVLSWAGLTGIYSPYTAEAHVNAQLPATSVPFTACHEVAHQRGFAREDEANFLAYWVCVRSDDPAWRYSGYLTAVSHGLGALAHAAPAEWLASFEALPDGVREDIVGQVEFWQEKRTTLTDVVETTNDLYLQAHGTAEGIESYGRMVDLIVAERRARGE